jgi:FixJ family two-component response regulator
MDVISVLVASACSQDFAWFEVVLGNTGWKLSCAHSLAEAAAFVHKQQAIVVVCEPTLPDGDWKQLLSQLVELGRPSALVVFSHLADERLWSEVLHLGGYDLLQKPFDKSEVIRTVTLAWQQCKHACGSTNSLPAAKPTSTDKQRNRHQSDRAGRSDGL